MAIPCTQEERIAHIEASVDNFGGKLDSLSTDVQLLTAEVRRVILTIEEHDRALKSNNGTIGLIAKVANALEVLSNLQEALRGKGEKPGLITTIDKLNKSTGRWTDTKVWVPETGSRVGDYHDLDNCSGDIETKSSRLY